MIFEKLADAIIKHPKQIIIAWVVLLLCAVPMAVHAQEVLNYDTSEVSMEDSESVRGYAIYNQYFYKSDTNVTSSPMLVIKSYGTTDEAGAAFQKLSAEYLNDPVRLSAFTDEDGRPKVMKFAYQGAVSGDSGETLTVINVLYYPYVEGVSGDTSELRNYVAAAVADYRNDGGNVELITYVTGTPAMGYDIEQGAVDDLSKIEPFTVLMILILVGLFFRSVISASTPPITIGFAFGITLSLVFFIGHFIDIYFITQMMILVTMMGAGCDYCIFILARYREERIKGAEHEKAMREAVVWAGESITISGISVIIGFGVLTMSSVDLVRSMGIVLALGIVIALIAALTLITSVLSLVGDKMFWPTSPDMLREGGKAMKGWYGKVSRMGAKYFHKSTQFSKNHAKAIVAAAVLITVPAVYVVATAETSYDMMGIMSTGESNAGMDEIEGTLGGGVIMPNYVVLELEQPVAYLTYVDMGGGTVPVLTWSPDSTGYNSMTTLTADLASVDNIKSASGIVKWEDAVNKATALWGMMPPDPGMAIILDTPEKLNAFEAHAIAGLTLKQLSSESALFALGVLTNMGLDVNLLEAMNTYVTSESPDALVLYFTTTAVLPPLQTAQLSSPAVIPVMDAAVNYMGGVLGGAVSAAGGPLNYVRISAITETSPTSAVSMDTIGHLGESVQAFADSNPGIVKESWITGAPALTYDLSNSVGDEFRYIQLTVVLLILLLLFVVMKSYLIPIRSVLTILMSVIWTVAVTHLLFTNLLGIGVIWLVPIILFVICLGLGMDYDILLTTRIRENAVHRGMDNDTAINEAVIHTGTVISICGIIMGGAFGTLMLSSMPMMQEFGFALCFAILLDALIIRLYVVPAVMHLLGKWNWVGPKWMQGKKARASEE